MLLFVKKEHHQPTSSLFKGSKKTSCCRASYFNGSKQPTEVKPEDPKEAKNYFKARDKSLGLTLSHYPMTHPWDERYIFT